MRKLISALLIMTMVLSLTACGGNKEQTEESTEVVTNDATTETENTNGAADTEADAETVVEEETENVETENTETEEPVANETEQDNSAKEENTSSSAPQTKPEANTQAPAKPEENKSEQKPANTQEQKPAEQKPADTQEQKPAEQQKPSEEQKPAEDTKEEVKEETSSATLGQTLLAVFKNNAGSMGTQALAEKLITNEAILFMGGAMPVEPGLLSGFDNAEITGFKEGSMFAPMMGSIAFVGYVFELEDGADVDAFKQTLKSNANPRWQICVAAEETIVASAGNKVFFLMCPKSLEQ